MRSSIKHFVKICAQTLPLSEPIYEFGSYQVLGQEGFADLRPFFMGKEYVGTDIREGLGVEIILNLHNINLPSESVGTVLILDTLEHVEFPRTAIEEVHRILTTDGILIISSVMNFPIHDYPNDYWRFTPDGFKSLLKQFNFSLVDSTGDSEFPHTVLGIASKGAIPNDILNIFMEEMVNWKHYWRESHQPVCKKIIKLVVPPIVIIMYQKLKRYNLRRKELDRIE